MSRLHRTPLLSRSGPLALLLLGVSAGRPCVALETIVPRTGLVIAAGPRGSREPFSRDVVQSVIVRGTFRAPKAGDTLEMGDGRTHTWEDVTPDASGRFQHRALAGGYVYVPITSPVKRVMLLEASSHSLVYVNGEPRIGDPYGYGYVRLPVNLRAGTNHFLFLCARGALAVKLSSPERSVLLQAADATLPDLLSGRSASALAAVVAVNATDRPLAGAWIDAVSSEGSTSSGPALEVPSMSTRKLPFRLPTARSGPSRDVVVTVRLRDRRNGVVLDSIRLTVAVRRESDIHRRTFTSAIDGSVQYYAVVPPRPEPGRQTTKRSSDSGLVLTLHGAGVEAIGQAGCYAPKRGMWIVAPTNRRPFGFDWEDWGRRDAMEVLDLAQASCGTDPARTYLTGHSMGGHGTWHLGVTYPGRFAAVAPSAGWISFQSYVGTPQQEGDNPLQSILRRASSSSDTLARSSNLAPLGVYILHGDADDNVPVREARAMASHLAQFHRDWTLFEQPGAGHWWGAPSDPGTGCVDWPGIFDLFGRRSIPRADEVRHVDFATSNPGVSSTMRWVTILQQEKPLALSRVRLRCDPVGRRYVGATENVATMQLDLMPFGPGSPVTLDLDGGQFQTPWSGVPLTLRREGARWRQALPPAPEQKRPERNGPFKEAFTCRFIAVYGTKGSPEENAWAFAKARFDAESFWYRGNGSVDVLPDTRFDSTRARDRSVILYGNAETNAAWDALVPRSKLYVGRDRVSLGDRSIGGVDLACLACLPKAKSNIAYVGLVGGTGIVGMRLTDRAPYFVSGVGYPDVLVWTPDVLTAGASGVRLAGLFGNAWDVETGDWFWQ